MLKRDTSLSFHGHTQSEPIGLEYIASALMQNGFTCDFKGYQELHVANNKNDIGISLLSCITCEYPKVLEPAKTAKKKGYTTIFGGYHACGYSAELDTEHFDYIVIGEGELITIAIANAILRNDYTELNSYDINRKNSTIFINTPRINDLDSLLIPDRSRERMSQYQYHLHDLMWPPANKQHNSTLVLASRGCYHDCDFCASSTVWGRGLIYRSPQNVVSELLDLRARFETNTIVFIDQSLGQAKQWTLDLCKAIHQAEVEMNWYHQSNLDINLDVIEEMAKAGCTKIGFGLEGISPRAVEHIKPINPRNFDAINALFTYCNSLGIFVKVYLMIGFPWETEKIIEEYYEWIPRIRANQIKISYMTPFPGTRDWDKYSSNLISRKWADFDTVSMPVVYNPNITVEQYHEIRKQLFLKFYGSPAYMETTHQMLKDFPHYVESYIEFINYLKTFNMIRGNEEWLKLLKRKRSKQIVPVANFQG